MGGLPRGRVFVAVQHSLATATREPEQISKGIVLPSVFLLSQESRHCPNEGAGMVRKTNYDYDDRTLGLGKPVQAGDCRSLALCAYTPKQE